MSYTWVYHYYFFSVDIDFYFSHIDLNYDTISRMELMRFSF